MDKALCDRKDGKQYSNYWFLILLAGLILYSCQNEDTEIRLLFTGDILLSRNVKQELNTRKDFPWDSLSALFHSADFVSGNLEGAIGEYSPAEYPGDQSPTFVIDSNDIQFLFKAGFDAVTIENNHSGDLGQAGKNQTISKLISNEIRPVCFDYSPYFFHKKAVVFSLIAINLVVNKDGVCQKIPSLEILRKLRLAKKLSNIVIVSVHWGSELLDWPGKEQRDAAEWLIMNGADIIIGHHPHIIQAPEMINGKPVFFSLGNHLFDQKYNSTKEGLIADIRIKNGKIYSFGIVTHSKSNSFYPVVKGSMDLKLEPVEYDDQLFSINGMHLLPVSSNKANNVILKGMIQDNVAWMSGPIPLIDVDKIRTENDSYDLFALEQHFSSLDNQVTIRPYVYMADRNGLTARWRGSGLAWPILDAVIAPDNEKILCALHIGDAFISPGNTLNNPGTAAYQWNGFGFKMIDDSISCAICAKAFKAYNPEK